MMDHLKEKYFSDLKKTVSLKKGELLLRQGETNHRLFLLESGVVNGFDPTDKGVHFQVNEGDFVGLHSFFSPSPIVQMSIVAAQDSVLLYFEKDIFSTDDEEGRQLAYDFMPLVMQLLFQRQKQIQDANRGRRGALREMQEVERLASLGQLSAGVAHELNNAITVIGRGSEHISKSVLEHLRCSSIEKEMIDAGLKEGRIVSGADARKIAKKLGRKSNFPEEELRDYARTGRGKQLIKEEKGVARRAFELWNLGATLHDLQLAVKHSEHVISSMRSLASAKVLRQSGCDVNESVQKALFLLANPLKNVNLRLELNNIPSIFGNSGELVQVWTNIIKNAIDAMEGTPHEKAKLLIKSKAAGDCVKVVIKDNGPGIPEGMVEEIFKPHVTTKKEGQTFGLGLGLTITQKIIKRYSGELSVDSSKKGTRFSVVLPIGEKS